jgi:hypothetical protein
MGRQVETKVVLDPETDLELKKWADATERSKRRQIGVLLRRLVSLRKTNPDELRRLELAN